MNIQIICDQILSPNNSTIKINGNEYKDVKSLKLILAPDGHGQLIIEHGSEFVESYDSEDKDASGA